MKHAYHLTNEERKTLVDKIGTKLQSYRLNCENNTAYEVFVLRFEDEDIEINIQRIDSVTDWIDEFTTAVIERRPNRDSWSPLGRSEPDNGIPPHQFMNYPVNAVITGVSVAVTHKTWHDEEHDMLSDGELVRALILHFNDKVLVFDKGAACWGDVWDVRWDTLDHLAFETDDDATAYPQFKSFVRIERIG